MLDNFANYSLFLNQVIELTKTNVSSLAGIADDLYVSTFITSDGRVDPNSFVKSGYSFINCYAIKDNIVYPVIYLDGQLRAARIYRKNLTLIVKGSNVLHYDSVPNSTIYVIFIKIHSRAANVTE